MSAPPNWVLAPPLRDATELAMRTWLSEHPHRRPPKHLTADEEQRDYAWALHRVPIASVPFVAEAVVKRSRGHWPKLSEVRDEVAAFLKRHAIDDGWVRVEKQPEPDTIARAQLAQCTTILRALDLDGLEVSRASQMHAIAATTEALLVRIRTAIASGKLPRSRIQDFRDATWPALSELDRIVRDIAAEGQAAVSASVEAMLATVPQPEGVPA
jgi:hypothetical protein